MLLEPPVAGRLLPVGIRRVAWCIVLPENHPMMLEPVHNSPSREDWDEHDWERFLQRADVRAAKFQELFETLLNHPDRDRIIAREMGWEHNQREWGCDTRDCASCDMRFDCEAYEMLRLMSEPESVEEDPDTESLIACFEEVREIPAYRVANDFAGRLEDALRRHAPQSISNEEVRNILFAAQMAPAQIAGGHGIGYDRDSLCGNIANCKRALHSFSGCLDSLHELQERQVLPPSTVNELRAAATSVATAIEHWIESLRARVWWC